MQLRAIRHFRQRQSKPHSPLEASMVYYQRYQIAGRIARTPGEPHELAFRRLAKIARRSVRPDTGGMYRWGWCNPYAHGCRIHEHYDYGQSLVWVRVWRHLPDRLCRNRSREVGRQWGRVQTGRLLGKLCDSHIQLTGLALAIFSNRSAWHRSSRAQQHATFLPGSRRDT